MKKIILFISIFFTCLNIVFAKETVKYASCVDGDTIKVYLNGEEETIRLLAIDTPESVKPDTEVAYYGKEASEYTCNKIKKAKKIEIEYDNNSDKRDKYDRILAWVFLDNKLLQTELVEFGYAKVAYLYDDYKYTDVLKEKQALASAKNVGIWDTKAKTEFENNSPKTSSDDELYSNIEVVILTILFLIFVLISKSTLKKKK